MRVRHEAPVDPERVWVLLSQPACWPAWAPHFSHVSTPEGDAPGPVTPGQALEIHTVVPRVSVDVGVTEVDPGRRWVMRATPLPGVTVESSHTLTHDRGRAAVEVEVEVTGPGAWARPLLAAYRPLALYAVRRLLDLAAADEAGAAANAHRMCHQPPTSG